MTGEAFLLQLIVPFLVGMAVPATIAEGGAMTLARSCLQTGAELVRLAGLDRGMATRSSTDGRRTMQARRAGAAAETTPSVERFAAQPWHAGSGQ